LWTGKKDKENIHLVNWNMIAKPKKMEDGSLKTYFVLAKN